MEFYTGRISIIYAIIRLSAETIVNDDGQWWSVVYWRQGEAGRRPGSSHNLKIFFLTILVHCSKKNQALVGSLKYIP